MRKYIKDTYILMFGANAKSLPRYLIHAYDYKNSTTQYPFLGPLTISTCFAGPLSNRLRRFGDVRKKVFDLYNVYHPIKPKPKIDIDWTDDELNKIIK